MNLIQISEQLKEAPDNLLLQEVKAPTGSYPSYLIISELSRRKRLRDGAQPQQAPQTTVADDLSQPAGLAATPQAMQSTAGMDVNGQGDYEEQQEMPQMAGGGLVAFKQGKDVNSPFALSERDDLGTGFYGASPGYEQQDRLGYTPMISGAIRDIESHRPLSDEATEAARKRGVERFSSENPFRQSEMEGRIAAKERAIEGERESNANMALMEAGLGMMGSRSPYGMQGIAEGGLRGLSSFKSGKQDIKKSEAYLDQAKDSYARAQELYDQQKYAAGDRAVARADQQNAQGLALANARITAGAAGRGIAKENIMFPMQEEAARLGLDVERATQLSKIESANLDPAVKKAQIAELLSRHANDRKGGLKLATPGEAQTAYALADAKMTEQKIPMAHRDYYEMRNSYAQQLLLNQGKVFMPPQPPQVGSRGVSQGGGLVQNQDGSFTYQPRK
jgi:hypothetical protein